MKHEQIKIDAFRILNLAKAAKISGGYFDTKPDLYGQYSSIFIDFKDESYFILPPYKNDNFQALNGQKFQFLGDLSNSTRAIKTIARQLVEWWGYSEKKDPLKDKNYNYPY